LLRLQLSCSTSDKLRRHMQMLSNDCISSASSGFASGSESPTFNPTSPNGKLGMYLVNYYVKSNIKLEEFWLN
jgi:hypothetical protein